MKNLKAIQKEATIKPNLKPGLLKKKPFKPATVDAPMSLMKRLTGK